MRGVAEAAQARRTSAEQQAAKTQSLLDALGPEPSQEEGAAEESAPVARERQTYTDNLAIYQSRIALADLTIARARSLDEALTSISRNELVQELRTRLRIPLAPSTLEAAGTEAVRLGRLVVQAPIEWVQSLPEQSEHWTAFARWFAVMAAAIAIAWAVSPTAAAGLRPAPRDYRAELFAPVRRGHGRRFGARIVARRHGHGRSWRGASAELAIHRLAANAAAEPDRQLGAVFPAVAVPRAILAPDLPAWRLTTLTPRNARLIHRLVFWIMVVTAFDWIVRHDAGVRVYRPCSLLRVGL